MVAATELTSDIVAGGTALGGLFLVYTGGLATSYSSFSREQQAHVRAKFQTKSWLAVFGLIAALLSAGIAIIAKWFTSECAASVSAIIFVIAIVWACGVAIISAKEIS